MNINRYTSFAEAAIAMGYEPIKSNKGVPNKRRDEFLKKHTCPVCKEPMTWVSETLVMSCKNPKCKGMVIKTKNEDGTITKSKRPSYHMLSKRDFKTAEILFGGGDE